MEVEYRMNELMFGDLVIPVLTIIASVGGAVFASGRMVGKLEEKVNGHDLKIAENGKNVAALRGDFERSLNNGIRKDISGIREGLAALTQEVADMRRADEQFTEACRKVQQMGEDVAFIRGSMAKTKHKMNPKDYEETGD